LELTAELELVDLLNAEGRPDHLLHHPSFLALRRNFRMEVRGDVG
jgi:hypothetical protein